MRANRESSTLEEKNAQATPVNPRMSKETFQYSASPPPDWNAPYATAEIRPHSIQKVRSNTGAPASTYGASHQQPLVPPWFLPRQVVPPLAPVELRHCLVLAQQHVPAPQAGLQGPTPPPSPCARASCRVAKNAPARRPPINRNALRRGVGLAKLRATSSIR